MKNKIIVISLMLLCGCVSYKHDTYPNGKQIQIGSYIEDPALSGPHWSCSKVGKRIKEMNFEWEVNWIKTHMMVDTNDVAQ